MPVRHVLALINHLSLTPQSRVYALEQGDIEWMGWDVNTLVAVRTHDLIASLIAGLSKDIDAETLRFRLPGEADPLLPQPTEELTFPTIAEFSAAMFSEFMYGKG